MTAKAAFLTRSTKNPNPGGRTRTMKTTKRARTNLSLCEMPGHLDPDKVIFRTAIKGLAP